jgi:hypothetical protein
MMRSSLPSVFFVRIAPPHPPNQTYQGQSPFTTSWPFTIREKIEGGSNEFGQTRPDSIGFTGPGLKVVVGPGVYVAVG